MGSRVFEFFSSRSWKPDEVTEKLADASGEKPARVQLFGCTDAGHASREGAYIAANNRYRRRFVRFRTELEGMIPLYGDLIAVSHDMPRWGQGGEIVAWTTDGIDHPGAAPPWTDAVLTLSEPPVWTDGTTHYIALRRRDGSLAGPAGRTGSIFSTTWRLRRLSAGRRSAPITRSGPASNGRSSAG